MMKWITKLIPKFIKTWFANLLYDDLAAKGIYGDTELAFLTPYDQRLLLSFGGSGSINPHTGLKQYNPLLIGLAVGAAGFGIAKLAGASTRDALIAGALAGFGAGGISALGTTTPTLTSNVATKGAGLFGTKTGTASALSAAGAGTTAAPTASFMLGSKGLAGATPTFGGGSIAGGGAILQGSGGAFTPIAQGGSGLTKTALTQGVFQAKDVAGNIVPLGDPTAQAISRTGETVLGTVPTTPTTVPATLSNLGTKAVDFAKENPLATGLGVLTAGQMVRDLSGSGQPTGTVPAGQTFDQAEYDKALAEQRPRFAGFSERAPAPPMGNLTPRNVYEEQEKMFTAKEGGLAALKLKQGGVNFLPSKSDHDEKDANNYVRAMGYVEDGSGNGDKDEDTMLAQLADGEFVSRADAILGAGIMSGANPDDFKEMRRKGAQFFYKQQDSFKRVYDLVNDRNQTS